MSLSYIYFQLHSVCMCVYSNSRNEVPRVAQRHGAIAAHTRRRASVLVVFCVHMYSFAGLIRRTPPPAFSDTAITDRHSDTTIFQLRAHWVRTACPACKASILSTRPGSPLLQLHTFPWLFIGHCYIALYYISWFSDFTIYTPLDIYRKLSPQYFILSKVYTHDG